MATEAVSEDWRIPDELCERIKQFLPPEFPEAKDGRPRMPNRQAKDAIFYMLRTGCQGKGLPSSLAVAIEVHSVPWPVYYVPVTRIFQLQHNLPSASSNCIISLALPPG